MKHNKNSKIYKDNIKTHIIISDFEKEISEKKQSKSTAKQKIEKSDLIEPNQIHKRTKKLLHHFWQTSQRIP